MQAMYFWLGSSFRGAIRRASRPDVLALSAALSAGPATRQSTGPLVLALPSSAMPLVLSTVTCACAHASTVVKFGNSLVGSNGAVRCNTAGPPGVIVSVAPGP